MPAQPCKISRRKKLRGWFVAIGKRERVALREVYRHEAFDFTQWLQDNIDVLNNVIDLNLSNPEREQAQSHGLKKFEDVFLFLHAGTLLFQCCIVIWTMGIRELEGNNLRISCRLFSVSSLNRYDLGKLSFARFHCGNSFWDRLRHSVQERQSDIKVKQIGILQK